MHGEGEGNAKHLSGDSGDLLLATEGQPHQKPSWLMDERNSPLTLPPGARGCVTEGVCISPHPGEYIVGIEPR